MSLSHLVSLKGIPSVVTHSASEKPSRLEILKELFKTLTGNSQITTMPLLVELVVEMDAFLSNEHNEKLRMELKNLRQELIVSGKPKLLINDRFF